MVSYHAIKFFDHTTSQIDHGHRIISSPNTYPYVSWSSDDYSIDEILETLSNIYLALTRDFLNHHLIISYKIFSLLIRNDWFLIDYSQYWCTLHHIQNIPYISQRVMLVKDFLLMILFELSEKSSSIVIEQYADTHISQIQILLDLIIYDFIELSLC